MGTGWEKGALWGSKLTKALKGMNNSNSNMAQFAFYAQQKGLNSTSPTKDISDENEIIHALRTAKTAGMKTFLKPVVEVLTDNGDYVWRGRIPGTNDWFKNTYNPYIIRMAKIAEREKVDIFSIGSELRETLHHNSQWKALIKSVRAVYSGKITYIANHDVSFSIP